MPPQVDCAIRNAIEPAMQNATSLFSSLTARTDLDSDTPFHAAEPVSAKELTGLTFRGLDSHHLARADADPVEAVTDV
jgi:hypothetical protein